MQVTNNSAAAADDFIPAPAATSNPVPTAAVENVATEIIRETHPVLGQTGIILASAAVLFVGVLLLLLRNAIRRSLIASRATIDSANTASWAWYFALLLIGVLIVAGVVGNLFANGAFDITAGLAAIAGISVALAMTSRARHSA